MRVAELQKRLRAADQAAVLVSPRILERVLRAHYQLHGLSWTVPHSKSFVIDRQMLFRHAEQADLELEPDQLLPDTVILLARPPAEELSALEEDNVLLRYWRRLFHASVHLALGTHKGNGPLSADGVRQRIDEIGRTEFEEIRDVLVQDRFLPPGADDRTAYSEFAAVYLELRYFAATLLLNYFPGIPDGDRVEQLLARDVDAPALFARTRLAGAPDPVMPADTRSDESHEAYWKLVRAAERADPVTASRPGNTVRAAILHTRAARVAPAAYTSLARHEAEKDIRRLTGRLAAALQLSPEEQQEWADCLILLLDKADQGQRPQEARLLDDLQKACLDHERDIFTLDVVEWALSAGKRPIKRPLPSQRLVRVVKHLRSAVQRLGAVRLSDSDRNQLTGLLQGALHKTEESLRGRFRPVLVTAMQDVGLQPTNPPERVAFDKMVEELLDRIIAYGFLTFADLRDAISRNQLKLPDLAEPEDFIRGDPLIRLDTRLASLLDGVYRPSEFYMRWLERLTALNFGTSVGRLFTRYVTVPFGGAYLILKGAEMLAEHIQVPAWPDVLTGVLTGLLGLFLLGLFQVEGFRRRCLRAAHSAYQGLRAAFVDFPRRALPLGQLRRLVNSWPFQLFHWFIVKPLAICVLFWWWRPDVFGTPWGFGIVFGVATFLLNSRIGRGASEGLNNALSTLSDALRGGLLPGLFRLIVQVFKYFTDTLEYVLFTVDEWLRFRSGDSQLSLVVRTVLGLVWFPVGYLIRFYMVVLIEPGINPIKFPVSSLAAKFVYPLILSIGLAGTLINALGGTWLAWAIVSSTVWLLPDAFGFLFWEIKENWSLYRANRRKQLEPAVVGAHGETVRGLLQPGFHSGTVPRLFTRLREAERTAFKTRNWHAARSYRHELDEIARALQRFAAREMVALLGQSPSWEGQPLAAGPVTLTTNRVRFELTHADHPGRPVVIELERREGWLVAALRQSGWLDRLSAEPLRAFTAALASLYKLAGIDLVREQLQANLPPLAAFDLNADGLVVWPSPGGAPVAYDLRDRPGAAPAEAGAGADGVAADRLIVDLNKAVFARVPLTWQQWVESWQKDQAGEGHPGLPGLGEQLVRLQPGAADKGDPRPSEAGVGGVAV